MNTFSNETSRTVTKGIYQETRNADGSVSTKRIGDDVTEYNYATNADNDRIRINGRVYKVVANYEFSIKIQKTQIQANGGASGLMKFLTTFQNHVSDCWEQKIFNNCRAVS